MKRMGRQRRRGSGALWLVSGVAAGIVMGWLTAPHRGGWTRNQARQKLGHWYRTSVQRLRKRGRDVENRVHGGMAELRETWSGREHYVDGNTLTDQVHTAIGREFAEILPHINLNAVGHTIYLHGYLQDADRRERLIHAIREVDGVEDVMAAELRVQPPVVQGDDIRTLRARRCGPSTAAP